MAEKQVESGRNMSTYLLVSRHRCQRGLGTTEPLSQGLPASTSRALSNVKDDPVRRMSIFKPQKPVHVWSG